MTPLSMASPTLSESAAYPSLNGKHVLVTGGATGIGAAIVEAYARQGACVDFIDIKSEQANNLMHKLALLGCPEPSYLELDMTDTDKMQHVIRDLIEQRGHLDVLINNVANDARIDPLSVTPKQWRESMAVNLDTAYFASQAVIPSMQEKGDGNIINLSSINALLGSENMPAYVSAKSALLGLTKSMAKQYGSDGIRVNAVLPGWVATERQLSEWLTEEAEEEWMTQLALKQRILPSDVANLCLFLGATDSRMITGQHFILDAGRT